MRLAMLAAAGVAAPAGAQVTASQAAPLPSSAAVPSAADQQLKALYERYSDWVLREWRASPEEADENGSPAGLMQVDAASEMRRMRFRQALLAELDRIPTAELSDSERINAAVLRTVLENAISEARFRSWEMPFNSDSAFWAGLTPRQGLPNAKAYRNYLGRMRDVPRFFAENITNMRAGLKRGFSVPRVTLEGRDASIAAYAETDVEKNPFYAAFRQMPENIPAAEGEALRAEARKLIGEAVVPAYSNLLTFFRNEYVPRARTTIAAKDLPQGDRYYAAQARIYTTLDLTPREIHEIGLREVARIEAEMQQTMREAGFGGALQEFIRHLRTDPQFYAKTPEELLMFSAWVAKRVDGKLGETIGTLPRRRFTILPVPDEIAPYYTAGRGGLQSCLMNTYDLPSRPLYNIPALTLHECAPGHSMQAALAEERPAVPKFRQNLYFSGYGEGWGLYSEWLGIGMGIYRTPYENFGRLSYEMWRAARLVIDTGIHQYGWSRERATEYLASRTALSEHEVRTEIDRYISWPGQALSYKLGEITIHKLRREAEAKLGPKFDQRAFHDAILNLGAVPLPVLESEIRRFIDASAQQPQTRP